MVIIIWILIVLFILLVSYQMFLAHFTNDIYYQEGLATQDSSGEFQSYAPTPPPTPSNINPVTLAEQNENNIIYLNGQIMDLSGNLSTLSGQVKQIVQAQQDSANEVAPSSPVNISGTTPENS
jgi:TolA-binding protein